MKKSNKSIGIKLKKVKSYQAQQKALSDWVRKWEDDQNDIINKLRLAVQRNDYSNVIHMVNQLQDMSEKRFTALNNVLSVLSDPDRQLKDLRAQNNSIKNSLEKQQEDVKEQSMSNNDNINIIEEVVKSYRGGMTLREIAEWNNINMHKVIKILVTAGVYSSETYDKIKEMRLDGETEDEIAYRLGLSKTAMNDYTPYKKGIYNLEEVSINAKRIRKYRKNKNLD